MSLHSLPIFVRLQGRTVVLVGSGEAAEAKRRLLERAGAVVVGEDALPLLVAGEGGTALDATRPFVPSEVEARTGNGALGAPPSTALGTNGQGEGARSPSPVRAEPVEARPDLSADTPDEAKGRPSTSSGRTDVGESEPSKSTVRAELVEALSFSSDEESAALRQAQGERKWELARLAIVVDDAAAVARLKARGILVNAVDRPELCDFTLPAIVDRDPVIVAIGTGGASAGLAAALRQRLEAILPTSLGQLAEALYGARAALREAYPDPARRRRALTAALQPGGAIDPLSPDPDVAYWLMDDRQAEPDTQAGNALVFVRLRSLDPDDLTLREARALAQADRVTHAADVPPAILDRARADADRIACASPPLDAAGLTVDVRFA
mgnify:CR=1 FL=1